MSKYVAEVNGVKFTEYQLQTLKKIVKGFGEFVGEVDDERTGNHGHCYLANVHVELIEWPSEMQFAIKDTKKKQKDIVTA